MRWKLICSLASSLSDSTADSSFFGGGGASVADGEPEEGMIVSGVVARYRRREKLKDGRDAMSQSGRDGSHGKTADLIINIDGRGQSTCTCSCCRHAATRITKVSHWSSRTMVGTSRATQRVSTCKKPPIASSVSVFHSRKWWQPVRCGAGCLQPPALLVSPSYCLLQKQGDNVLLNSAADVPSP